MAPVTQPVPVQAQRFLAAVQAEATTLREQGVSEETIDDVVLLAMRFGSVELTPRGKTLGSAS